MNPTPRSTSHRRSLVAALLAIMLGTVSPGIAAAPGAHGPGGEHLDAAPASAAGSSLPRLEASSEAFELLAVLHRGGLSILVDRYATNEPVLGGSLEVESGGIKANATFQADRGDYAVDDPALLKKLATPGEHALVFTLITGTENDLLDGTMVVAGAPASAGGDHGHGHGAGHDHRLERAAWVGAGIAGLGLLGLLGWIAWSRRRRQAVASRRTAMEVQGGRV